MTKEEAYNILTEKPKKIGSYTLRFYRGSNNELSTFELVATESNSEGIVFSSDYYIEENDGNLEIRVRYVSNSGSIIYPKEKAPCELLGNNVFFKFQDFLNLIDNELIQVEDFLTRKK